MQHGGNLKSHLKIEQKLCPLKSWQYLLINNGFHVWNFAGDDSDAFADDEAPSSDGMEERDDVSLVSTVSSVGEDDNYLSEPTYNNLDPVWAQRHGFGPGGISHSSNWQTFYWQKYFPSLAVKNKT